MYFIVEIYHDLFNYSHSRLNNGPPDVYILIPETRKCYPVWKPVLADVSKAGIPRWGASRGWTGRSSDPLRGEGDGRTEAEPGGLWTQVKDCLQPSAAGRGQGHVRLESLRRKWGPADASVLDQRHWPHTSGFQSCGRGSSCHVCGNLLQRSQETTITPLPTGT